MKKSSKQICLLRKRMRIFVKQKETNLKKIKIMKTIKTHKATLTEWRVKVLDALNMTYKIKGNMIIYKGILDSTLVNFLIDKRIELGINPY